MTDTNAGNHPLVSMRDIHKRFPGVYALRAVNLEILPGTIHALMGENGAGKSTLIKIMSGAYPVYEGEYLIENKPAEVSHPMDAIKKGISVIYQELNLVQEISIAENIYFGRLPHTQSGRVLWKKLKEDSTGILKKIGLDVDPMMKVDRLPIAQQQLVEIAKAISQNARVIIMDEPTSALSPKEIKNLFSLIKKLRKEGVGILYVSHKLDEIFELADMVTVLRDGCLIGRYPIEDLSNDKLISLMVGRELTDLFPKTEHSVGKIMLDVKDLSTEKIHDINFNVKKGEIVGFSGLMGSGRSELARALIGADKKLNGTILINEMSFTSNSPSKARFMGLGLIPEDRKHDGIFTNMDVLKNISIVSLKSLLKGFTIHSQMESTKVGEIVEKLSVKTPSISQNISKLSGGNQQKAILARWLMNEDLRVLIIDEPTRGIDVGAKSEIYALIDQLAKDGLAIIMMSSELPEILGMCDRIYVMKDGRINGEFDIEDANEEKLLAKAIHS
ncbi:MULTISPECIES: sugar ABC transporter ATP-binding protein [unclassified Oceanispirochaeta]|uniref:sugar ABC transporter ATP-binding protein n=1 Tax=unclassified Oceanispirochaeta TaxID=2635722 RepID=UPI000E08EAE8|nr:MULTISPECIES: sugar ABC transporter ATP-binding protein [unclassified Oceanispirochaeta]MBF9018194.1 sugar ABC transporter ATP-binding protein [Oceanispirochaeta sp. M2]NPD74623.1 sugar ABC transporter ATP-binding protein [Oceanispirochaeta sp. M1]RDG29495.1 sugar ABC transporter ATP-binding protein [Oceanispirochaeta sp. M1]